jgi:hypothetical protein
MSSAREFARIFSAQATFGVEYSFEADKDRDGIMIAGKPPFIHRLEQLATQLPYAGDWSWAVRRFSDYVHPDAYLVRVDCHADEIVALTLYCRFPKEPTDAEFEKAMTAARPLRWGGPSPSVIAAPLGVPGPRGIGFRVDLAASCKTALYYKVATQTKHVPASVLPDLVQRCGFPLDLAPLIDGDIRSLYPPGPVGVIGVDSDAANRAGALKFDPANVPLQRAFTFLAGKGASRRRIAELTQIADSLRAVWLSYLGIKYGPKGFSGWRVYFSTRPSLLSSPTATRVVVESIPLPTLRLPHY